MVHEGGALIDWPAADQRSHGVPKQASRAPAAKQHPHQPGLLDQGDWVHGAHQPIQGEESYR